MANPTLRELTGMNPDPAPIADSALVLIDCQQTYREGIMQLENVEPALHEAGVPVLVAVGEQARPLGQGFDAAGGTAHYCASVDEAAAWVLAHTAPGDRILVKGSRSAAMERILPLLAAAEPGDPSNGN